ncbi:MAG: septum formation protein Maf [Ruminococcaceae bacterium]|nr:septum formation protein Maf [Oscillospiraceae bacterium]
MNIFLASKSKRRQKILQNLGISFKTAPSDADEKNVPDLPPDEYVSGLAVRKLRAAREQKNYNDDDLIICADTVVSYDGLIMGKPENEDDAFTMLTMLSGNWHEVYTGVAIAYDNKIAVDYEVTRVKFRELSSHEIEKYIASGEPMDKAGAYGIQDTASIFVERTEGDFFNIVGLPVCKLGMMLKEEFNIELFDLIK